jgi:hypothetical protein
MARLRLRISEDGLRREVLSGGTLPELFFEITPRAGATPPRFDGGEFALTAMLPIAMHHKADLHLDFEVDRTLLDGLDHYQEVWHSWRPDVYRKKIKIETSGETSRAPSAEPTSRTLAAFSAGLDSTFTLSRHARKEAGRAIRDVRTAVMVHGFDMPLDAVDGFETLAGQGAAICRDLGVDLVTVKTNCRQLIKNWEMTFGAGLASVLQQFSHDHDIALIATEESYQNSFPVWGNSFWNDRFFSSSKLKIESDGGAYDRIERARYLAKHRSLVPHLRVCWAGPRTGENCGVCTKCVLTKLNFVAAGVDEPWPFPQGLTAELVSSMPLRTPWQRQFLQIILSKLENSRSANGEIFEAVRRRLEAPQPRRKSWRSPKAVLTSALWTSLGRAKS